MKRELVQCRCLNWCSHNGKQYGSSSKQLKIELPYDPTVPFLGEHLNKNKILLQNIYMHFGVHSIIIYNSQDMEAT